MDNLTSKEICKDIVEMIKSIKHSDREIEVKHNATYSSIIFLGIHTLRIQCSQKHNYIWVKNIYEYLWANNESLKIERLKSEKLWSRIPFHSLEELKDLYPFFLQLYDGSFSMVNVELFSCCSRFVQCSDEKACIQPDKLLSLGCQYRKHLAKGKIFYGKNRNV